MAKRTFLGAVFGFLRRQLNKIGPRKHKDVKRFDAELKKAGDLQGTADKGVRPIDVDKVVGSVGRWKNLRSDFFYKHGKAITQRFMRIGQAMKQGKILPAIDLYKIKQRQPESNAKSQESEYYVVDGHHRVAMAKKLGQDFLDAHVVEYKVDEKGNKVKPAAESDTTSQGEQKPLPGKEDKPESKQSPSEE